jgi:rubrerythrin
VVVKEENVVAAAREEVVVVEVTAVAEKEENVVAAVDMVVEKEKATVAEIENEVAAVALEKKGETVVVDLEISLANAKMTAEVLRQTLETEEEDLNFFNL